MKPLTTKEKINFLNERFPRHPYQFDRNGSIFYTYSDGQIEYVSEREIHRTYERCFVRGIRQKTEFKKRVNRINRHKEKVLSKDEETADNLSGIVHRGEIWEIC